MKYLLKKRPYIKSFSKKQFYISSVIFGFILVFNKPIKKIFLTLSKSIFNDLPNTDNIRSIVITIPLISALIHIRKQLLNKKYPTSNSLIIALFISIIYFSYFRNNSDFYFFKWFFSSIYVFDIIIIITNIYIIQFETFDSIPSITESYLLEDNSSLVEDTLKRTNFAKSIASIIEKTNPKNSFSIALLSGWGFGKSTFLKQIEKETKNNRNIIINFNPWKFGNHGNIIQFFFDELSNELQKHNYSISKEIQIYTQKLFETEEGDSIIIKVIKSLIGNTFFQTYSIEEQHDIINKLLQNTGKKIIILIDDLDRLSGEEIIPILQLIRNIANFQNLIFVTAFDRSYVINSLSKVEKITNEQQYLEKIFQLEIPLPPIKPEFITQELLLSLKSFLNKSDLAKINVATGSTLNLSNTRSIENLGLLLPLFLKNIRDIKRFTNSLKVTYDITKNELLFDDIFVLELIKYKSLVIYENIANMTEFFNNDTNNISFNPAYYKNFLENNKNLKELYLSEETKSAIEMAIGFLYPKDKKINKSDLLYRPISIRENHYLYFNYLLFEKISIKEFTSASENGIDDIIKLIERHKHEIYEYIDIVEKSQLTGFYETSKTLLISLVYCDQYVDSKRLSIDFIIHKNISNYYLRLETNSPEVDNLNEFLNTFLSGEFENILNWKNSHLVLSGVSSLLIESPYLSSYKKILLGNERLIDIINYLFMNYLERSDKNEETIYELLSKTRSLNQNDQSDTLLNEQMCKEYFKHLQNNYTYYISILIRPYTKGRNLYVFDPHILQIFGSYNEFKRFLSQLKNTNYSKYYLEKFNEYELNNYNPIEISNFENLKLSYHTV